MKKCSDKAVRNIDIVFTARVMQNGACTFMNFEVISPSNMACVHLKPTHDISSALQKWLSHGHSMSMRIRFQQLPWKP
jgi:hypothetical protein